MRTLATQAECGCRLLRHLSAPSMNLPLPVKRQKHRFTFPRMDKAFLERQEKLRIADNVPEGAELIFLLPKDRSLTLVVMDLMTVGVGYALFSSACPPEYHNECLLIKSVIFLAFLLFAQRRLSSACQRIYRLEPNTYFAVFPRYFFPKKVKEFRGGEVTLKDGVFQLEGRRMYCGGRFFKSYDHIEKMLKS